MFCKYKVKDFTVRTDPVRYYVITSIYRPFDESIDQGTGNSNTITEVNYAVNKQYCFGSINGNPYCSVVDIETIVVTDKFVGFVRYPDGFKLYIGALQCQGDHAGLYKYKKALAEGKSVSEAKRISRQKTKK